MNQQEKLSLYERGIMDALVHDHGVSQKLAHQIIDEYIEVIRALGAYDNCHRHAEYLIQAYQQGCAPVDWLMRIDSIEEDPPQQASIQRMK